MNLLNWATDVELLSKQNEFEDYLVSINNKCFAVFSITYEYEEPQYNFYTKWYDTKELALKEYAEIIEK